MAKGVKVTERDRGYRKRFKAIRTLGKGASVTVGVHSKDGDGEYEGGITVLDVAQWMEFGTSRVPERSFIRAYVDENKARIEKMIAVQAERVVAGALTRDQALAQIGAKLVGEIQQRMSRGIPPPLADATVKAKGSSTPLINTGQLRAAISFEVQK